MGVHPISSSYEEQRTPSRTKAEERVHLLQRASSETFVTSTIIDPPFIWGRSKYERVHCTRALSLRNLVSGYECGRVFPAGVGPGSPSRDALCCLRDSACRLRRGAEDDGVPSCAPLPSPNLVPFGMVAARERQGVLSRRAW